MLDLPLWLRVLVIGGLALACAIFVAHRVDVHDDEVRQAENNRVMALWNAANAKANEQELERAQANGRETMRRLDRQGENHDASVQAAAASAADRASARDAARVLDDHVAVLESIARGAAASDSASVADRQAADAAIRMLAQLQRRTDALAGIYADYADAARIAGATCQRDYEALTP